MKIKGESMMFFCSFIKRVELIAFIIGFVAGLYMLIFFPAKYFFAWHALPVPPEPVAKIFSADHMGKIIVTTTSNKKFICNLGNEKECWTEIDYEPFAFGTIQCFENCRDNQVVQIIRATGQLHNFGELSFIYSLHDDGSVYVKQTGLVYLPGYIMGVIFGGFCALIAFIGKQLFMSIISLLRKKTIK